MKESVLTTWNSGSGRKTKVVPPRRWIWHSKGRISVQIDFHRFGVHNHFSMDLPLFLRRYQRWRRMGSIMMLTIQQLLRK